MYNHDHSKRFANSARVAVALCAFAALGGRAAQAGSTRVTTPSQLVNPVTTDQFPTGTAPDFIVPASFTVAAGSSNSVTFTATRPAAAGGFQSVVADSSNVAPQFTMAPFGAPGDIVENTSVPTNTPAGNMTTGPLQINFQNGVAGFGLLAQDFNQDTETFTLDVFNGSTQIGTFSFGPTDNTMGTGQAVFVGAQATMGDLITSATLRSLSLATGGGGQPNNGNNDFFFGRTQVQNAPVPEASTVVSFGLGVLLVAGLTLGAHKRKLNGAQAAG
jgi:hypothetical protein